MPALTTTMTNTTTIGSTLANLDASQTQTASTTIAAVHNVNNDYLMQQQHHQQQQQQQQHHQQQQFNNHYYQHHQQQLQQQQQHPVGMTTITTTALVTTQAAAATSPTNASTAATTAQAAAATGSATFNGNSILNSNLPNGNNKNHNNNNNSSSSINNIYSSNNSHGNNSNNNNNIDSHSVGGGGNMSNGVALYKSDNTIGKSTLATSQVGSGGVLKKTTIIGTELSQQQQQHQQQQLLHASREDISSLGGNSSINSQMSTGATNANNNNSNGIINGIHHNHHHHQINHTNPSINSISNGNGNVIRQPSSILKGSKENLLQHYYNGDGSGGINDGDCGGAGAGVGGGSSIGSESGIIGGVAPSTENDDPGDGLGPLPPKWETAYTERGELYFIDHNTGTSHWLDPRLSKFQKKSLEDCCEDELPYGWEKIQDSLYGTYFIDHVNRRTQYENPVLEAKRRAAEQKKSQQQQQRVKTPTSLLSSGGVSSITNLNGSLSTHSLDISQRAMHPPPPPQLESVEQQQHHAISSMNNKPPMLLLPYKFTRNPAELQGERITTTLMKSTRGLGITIVGGDNNSDTGGVDEFLQIKSIVPNGPAWLDGQLQMGDVLVYVNDTCVLGFTHHEMVNIFQSIMPGETATLEVCRGYPLPFDPNDPNTEVVTTIAVDGITSEPEKQRRILMDLNMDGNYNFLDVSGESASVAGTINKGSASQFILMKKPEIHNFSIIKGSMGFGFTIADSATGQKVKKILDRNCCTLLQEGDVLLEINEINVRNMSHVEVVQVLKECSKTTPTSVKIQRVPTTEQRIEAGGGGLSSNFGNVAKLRKNFVGGTAALTGGGLFRSKTPTADLYSTQQKEVLPMRPKTPLVDTRRARVKTPNNELNDVDVNVVINGIGNDAMERTLAESKSQVDGKSNNSLQEIDKIPYMDPYPKLVSRLSERLAETTLLNTVDCNGVGSAGASGYNIGGGGSGPVGNIYGRGGTNYENQEYVCGSQANHNIASLSGGHNYNPIYGMTTMPPSMHPINHQGAVSAGHVSYPTHTTPLSLMTAANPSATSGTIYQSGVPPPPPQHVHHESCYCYDCQDIRKYRFGGQTSQTQPSPRQSVPMSYFNQQQHHQLPLPSSTTTIPLTSLSYSMGAGANHLVPPTLQQAQYSPLSNGAGGTLQAAHIQNERMQKRVNELLNDRRRVGFSPLDSHAMGHHHMQQQHSPAVSSISQQAPVNWMSGGGYSTLPPQPLGLHLGGAQPRNGTGSISGLLDVSEDADQYELTEVTLERQALGFGFRIVGGTEEGSQVTVGHIVPGGAADNDHRITTGDEILSIDGINVVNASHHKVVSLVGESALRGQVTMILRRRISGASVLPSPPHQQSVLRHYPYDVIVGRSEHEGFGFVIISSSNQFYGSTIGKLIPGSPADRCGELKVGDRIIAVNRIDIAGMSHGDVVNLIKESGLHVRLTIGCPIKEGPSPSGGSSSSGANPQVSPSQSQLLKQPPAPSLHTHPLNGLTPLNQPQQQQKADTSTTTTTAYIERPSTSAAAAAALSLHQQPQL